MRTAGLAFALAALVAPASAQGFSAHVVGVVDGDSLRVLTASNQQLEVRLDGIDCPELGQDFGRRAKQYTSDLLFGRTVEVHPKSLDRYGRTVARVTIVGRDASTEIIRAGFAWHFLKYSSDPLLAAAEREARAESRGLWQQPGAVAPWDFRAGRAAVPEGSAGFHGNTNSHVFHRAGCRNYGCSRCTQEFSTREQALAAGYRPAGCCQP